MRAAISIYEHPDFSDASSSSSSPSSTKAVCTAVAALTALASGVAVYHLVVDSKPFCNSRTAYHAVAGYMGESWANGISLKTNLLSGLLHTAQSSAL